MEPTDQLAHVLPAVCGVVDGLDPMQLHAPTPCREFDVHGVLDHLMVGAATCAYLFRGEDPPEMKAPPVYGRVPDREFHQAMDDLFDAVRSPGALDRTIATPFGPMRGEDFARFLAFDVLVHGWDLSQATGQRYRVDPDVVAVADDFARQALTPDLRDGDVFAAEVDAPDGADRLQRLVAFSGREC